MRTVLTLFRKDALNFVRDRTALSLTFLVPFVLIYIFGQIFGVNRGSSAPTGIPLAIVDQSNGAAAARAIIDALRAEKTFRVITTEKTAEGQEVPLTEERVRAMFHDNQVRFALVFPPDTQSDANFGLKLRFLNNPRNEIETQTVTGLLQRTVFTAAPSAMFDSLRKRAVNVIGADRTSTFYRGIADNVARNFGGDADSIYRRMMAGELPSSDSEKADPPNAADPAAQEKEKSASATPPAPAGDAFLDRILKIESEQLVGKQVKNAAATRNVGGWAIMFLLFSVSGASTSLFEEKRAGLFLRLLAAPVTRAQILWSKYLFCVVLGLVQLTSLFIAGRFLFGIDVTSNFGNLLLISLATAIACTAFGMLIASIARSPAAASGLSTFLILTMSAVGGAWFPVSFMPEFIQTLSRLTLVYWSMEGFVQVLWADGSLRDILPYLGVLLGIAAVISTISLWRFKRGDLFD